MTKPALRPHSSPVSFSAYSGIRIAKTVLRGIQQVATKKPNCLKNNLTYLCWDTRTRTRNDRTRICSVTITPYPNVVCNSVIIRLRVQRYSLFCFLQNFHALFFIFLFFYCAKSPTSGLLALLLGDFKPMVRGKR